jgi:hypothetical protein
MIDTRSCKNCGIEFSKVSLGQITGDYDGTFNEGYCNKFCRREHEKQLKLECVDFGAPCVLKDTKYRDSNGERIWFPKDGKPYYDRALGRKFNSIQEKQQHMKEKGIVMDGSSDPIRWPIEAGDMRSKSYRKQVGMED